MIRLQLLFFAVTGLCALAAPLENPDLQRYFEARVQKISSNCLGGIESLSQWEKLKSTYRAQLQEMLGLAPFPPKTDLQPVVVGRIERGDVVVEKLQFQSMPGLYVTANLYLPKQVRGPLPTILYVCGHGPVKTNGISYGNKVAYQHHGVWFARNGYACLTLDTIQLGEIEGLHHGTYREGMWWWNSRGYTPAGVEAWNCIRALDYLEGRPEVDKARFGVTGRSGGGAYSWWIAALDERIKVAAPVAGITDLQNYVVDGAVEGHCDCMFFVNTYQWDYPVVAALVAPRPLLICNSDKDTIFPLDGVLRTHAKTKRIYELYNASANLGLLITEGPHKDTQDLQLPVFRWFNRFLKNEDPVIEMAATKLFAPEELKVFRSLPNDERSSRIHESFTSKTPIVESGRLRQTLRSETFRAWPTGGALRPVVQSLSGGSGREVQKIEFESDEYVRLRLLYLPAAGATELRLYVITESDFPGLSRIISEELGIVLGPNASTVNGSEWLRSAVRERGAALAFLMVRGDGSSDPKKVVQIRRRYMLVGETLDGMRVWDIERGVELLRSLPGLKDVPLEVIARGRDAANAVMYCAMTDNPPNALALLDLPASETAQPDYLNYARFTSLAEIIGQLATGGFGRPVKIVTAGQAKVP